MICQECKEKNATVHIKTIVNGQLAEYYLCADCAKEKGYGNVFVNFENDFGNLLGGFLGGLSNPHQIERCEHCGSSFADITAKGKIGCAHCYDKFREELLPMIQRIHGEAKHKGKRPGGSALRIPEPNRQMVVSETGILDAKKLKLKKAIEEQDFERAAVLRDEIKEIEQNG
ncbi:UvrB/UvrC motif-containing protein [Scatolibacter rhodanostii]|uniref:UvrB/UvrC motif-containing protein n=1 Tax=Scatolibacter rhodanostii TaxID=2014781 RepID=UPI000C069F74|nr:UvrB/UvrC motif-containing protein [Scatolibacter rhodanostii]